MRNILFSIAALIIMVTSSIQAQERPDFEALMSGNGNIGSYIYFKQDYNYFVDTELNATLEVVRYKQFYFLIDLAHEIYMGRKYNSNMVFDPNRGGWAFGLGGRIELEKYFIDMQMHHDCFHDVGRWETVDFSVFWNTPRFGFGSKGYLPKYRYHQPKPESRGLLYPRKIDYYFQTGFFAPRGNVWQKNHDYEFTTLTNFNILAARYRNIGLNIESNNLWVVNSNHDLKRRHGLNFDFTVYGQRGVFTTYIAWWPYDSQSIRNRDGKTAFGIHFGF